MRRTGAILAFAMAVAPFALPACSDRATPALPSPDPAALQRSSPGFEALPAFAAELAMAIQAQIDGRDAALGTRTQAERAELHQLYRAGGYSALWLEEAGDGPNRNARDARALLNAAADDGLDPGDYQPALLGRLAADLEAESPPTDRDLPSRAAFDVTFSSTVLRYLRDLHSGRVDPRRLGLRLNVPADWRDFAGLLVAALASHRIVETAAELRPPLNEYGQYGALRKELTRYRALPAEARRVRQIELALERLRWLPELGDERLVVINIPMFRLSAWDSPSIVVPSFNTNVIVGRALGTQTPVFVEEMREVIFRPYWNVPSSILRGEILPTLERDPDYLRRQDMEIVRGPGDDARPVPATAENIADLRLGVLRLRQRPGPHNSLGLIKFVFPNEEDVYMHGTPAQELFKRSRRDFSHGCVRIEDPVALAEWVLKGQPEWNHDRILASMAGSQSLHVKLTRPVQVILFYTTAAVLPEEGTVRFAEDIYRHDARLDRALAARRSAQ